MTTENIEALGSEAMHCLLRADHKGFEKTFLSKCDPQTIRAVYEITRDLAKKAFASGDFDQALQHYTGMLAFAPNDSERAKLFSNRSLCCLKLRRIEDAVEEAKKAIASDPKWDKAWFRAGRAFLELGKVAEALATARYALRLRGFADPHTADLSIPEVRDVHNLYRLALEQDIKIKRKQRYETNYERFHKLADELTALEHAAEQAELQAQPIIEFAPGLTEEQKLALTLQLTGQYDERLSAKVLEEAEKRVVLDLGVDRPVPLNPKHTMALGSLLQLQYEASYGQRLLSLLDSGVASRWAKMTTAYLLRQKETLRRNIVYLGYESLLSAATAIIMLRGWRLERPADFSSLRVHLCSRSMLPAAYDFLIRILEANTSEDPVKSVSGEALPVEDYVLIHSRRELLSAPSLEEQDTQSGSSTPPPSNGDESDLALRGGGLVGNEIIPVPRSPEVVILDPASLEGFLLGSLSPIHDLRSFSSITLFPRKVCLWADFLCIRLPSHLQSSLSVQSALQWSLLPQKLPPELSFETVSTISPKLLYTLDSTCTLPPSSDLNFDLDDCTTDLPNAVRFYLTIYQDETEDILDTRNEEASSMSPHFWWLVKQPGNLPVVSRPNKICFKFSNGQVAAVRICDESNLTLLQSDPIVCNSCDRYLWANQVQDNNLYPAWAECVRTFRENVIQLNQTKSRIKPSQPTKIDVDFLHLDVGSASSVIHTIISILQNRPQALQDIEETVVTSRLLSFDMSQGTCRLIKGAVRNPAVLQLVRDNCWQQTPALLTDQTQWRSAQGELIDSSVKTDLTNVCDWLCGRDAKTRSPLRWSIECGSVRTLRPCTETADTRMALCALYGVSPGTPGLDNLAGCQILTRMASGIIIGDIATLPPDGLSQGILPTVLYARRALSKRGVQFLPSQLRIMGMLVQLPSRCGDLNIQPLRAVRNPARSAGAAANNLTDAHCFNYGTRTDINWAKVEGGKILSTAPKLLAHFDFGIEDEGRLLAPMLKPRLIPEVTSEEEADGLLIWSEWTLVGDVVVGNPPPHLTRRVKHRTQVPQAFQLLPRRPMSDMEFLPLPSMTDFVITWKPRASDPSFVPRDERQIAASTSMLLATVSVKQDELAMQLGQQLLTSPKSAKELATTAIGLVRDGEESIRNHLLDSSVVNNLLYATLA